GTYTAASFSGGYGFLADRPVVVGNSGSNQRTEFAQVGEYTFDGSSTMVGQRDDTNNNAPLNPNPLGVSGNYAVGASGINGRGTATTLAADSNRTYVFYTVSSSGGVVTRAFMLQTFTAGSQTNGGALNAP